MAGENPSLKLSEKDRKKYKGKWVACYGWNNLKVLASGDAQGIALSKARKKGVKHPITFFVDSIKTQIS